MLTEATFKQNAVKISCSSMTPPFIHCLLVFPSQNSKIHRTLRWTVNYTFFKNKNMLAYFPSMCKKITFSFNKELQKFLNFTSFLPRSSKINSSRTFQMLWCCKDFQHQRLRLGVNEETKNLRWSALRGTIDIEMICKLCCQFCRD